MYLIHGTWIPEAIEDFVQLGSFYLWVETDTTTTGETLGAGDIPRHPRHLVGPALVAFLSEKLGIQPPASLAAPSTLAVRYFLLPSAAGAPLPAYSLQPYLDVEVPDDFELASWRICCFRVGRVIPTLNDIHFAALNAADDFQLGTDLLFWHQVSRVVKQVVGKDQFLPSMKYRVLPSAKGKRSKSAATFEIVPGWELVSEAYEAAIREYSALMPIVGRAGAALPGNAELYEPESLLRQFSECLLHEIVAGTPFTAALDQQLAGTLLSDCVYPQQSAARARPAEAALEEYRQWAAWREKLTRSQTTAGFTLCFRLEEASPTDPDDWTLHFLVAARSDPSLKLDLADYWSLAPPARAQAARPFGSAFEKDLLLALGQAARIYPKLWTGLETAQPREVRLTLDEAFLLLSETAWVLEDAGYTVIVPAWWTPAGRRRAKVRLKTSARSAKSPAAAGNGYLSLETLVAYQPELMIGGEMVSEDEWRALIASKTPLVQFRGQWIELDRAKMQELLEFWKERERVAPELTLPDLLKLSTEGESDLEWELDDTLQQALTRLQDKSGFAPVPDPPNLRATLRDYQRRGVAWLGYLESVGLNPCLADDMGLGKTLEVIAHLVREQNEERPRFPTLVIAPTSVLGNWRKEIERFAPQLRTLVHHGSGRIRQEAAFKAACGACDVIITSFALARLDEKLFRSLTWHRVVLDEAQNIKNPEAAQTRAVGKLPALHRLALTGTPVENRLLDLWSIFNFLNPGYLGKQAQFRKSFELPIQKDNDRARSATLKKLVEPFILRRLKTDQRIIADLPDKIEQKMFCNLTPEQASLYAAVVADVTEQLEQAEGIQRRGLILATLMKLKQICNHPAQFLQDGSSFSSERSHKLSRLVEMVAEAVESGESTLVFTQFTEIGSALEEHLKRTLRCQTFYLHGGTSLPRRERMVEAFQDPDGSPSVFILSLRAGGVGLNLTRANHVFHFDRWWNPAVEDQATDRAFRIGQRKNVFVHKFVAIGTVEERIDQMIEDKKRVSSAIVGADESWLTELDNETFKDLIALRQSAVLE
ncbi:MAG TPA: DEAD/DEAH box helicase [Chloroflexota bacterium]